MINRCGEGFFQVASRSTHYGTNVTGVAMNGSERLAKQGIETLGDLGRLAMEHGNEAAIRLVADACGGTRKEFLGR